MLHGHVGPTRTSRSTFTTRIVDRPFTGSARRHTYIYIYICTAGTCFLFITTQPGNSPEDRSAPLRLPIDLLAIDREKGLDERSLMTLSYEKRLRQSMRSESRSFSSRNILYSGDLSIAGRLRAVPIGLADPLVPWKLTTRSDGARGP